ncbi:MAG: hypothetical protein QE271_05930 [Bacteriovoracaceae bacterium]|nr:hypothetical protein [Bacteriovoracaceae bacterium]
MEKLLQIIERVEKIINGFLGKLFASPLKIISKERLLLPVKKTTQTINKLATSLSNFVKHIIQSLKALASQTNKTLSYYYRLVFQSLFILKTQGLKKTFDFIYVEITARCKRFIHWIENLGPKKFFFLSLLVLFAILNAFHLVSSSKKFVVSLPFMQEKEAENPKVALPDYYNFREKKIRMNEVKFPLFMNGPRRMKHLNLDLTVEFNNRTAQMYFLNNRIIFQDHLQLTLEPMDPQFSLTDEGKNIQREKIKYEIDQVLKTREIAGEVKAVHIEYLLVN